MTWKFLGFAGLSLAAICLLISSGCGGGVPSLADLNDTNIRRLHSAYKIYMQRNDLTGPASEEELKEFLTTNQTAKVLLQRMGVESESIDDMFISDRDGEPFKIRWGVKGVEDHAIVFEAVGINNKRMVAFTRTRELGPDEYEGYWTGTIKGQKPGQRIDDRSSGETE